MAHALAAILITLHSVLRFVGALGLPIELADADQVQGVCKELALDLHVELTVAGKTGRQVDLDKPWFKVAVNHDVEAVHLVAIRAVDASLLVRSEDGVLGRQEALDDDIEDARPEEVHVDVNLLQVLAEGGKAPLEAEVVVVQILVLYIVLALFIDRVIRQVHELISLGGMGGVFLRGKAG